MVTTAGLALAACGSGTKVSSQSKQVHHNPPPVVTKKHTPTVGWNKTHTILTLPHVGQATKTITALAKLDTAFYHEVINPAYWVKSNTFGQYIFVGPYTSGKQYRQVRDAKLGAVDSMEANVLFSQGSTSWPSKIGSINADAFEQKALSNMPSLVAVEKYDAKNYPGKTFKLDVPTVATIIESPVGEMTPTMMGNSTSQQQYSVPGTCIPHTFATYFSGTHNAAINSGGIYVPLAVYDVQYGPTDNLVGTNSSNGSSYNNTTSCQSMP